MSALETESIRLADEVDLAVRPIRRSDAAALLAFQGSLLPQTHYQRFLAPHPHPSRREVDQFTSLDHDRRDALVALDGDDIVAVARYDRTADHEAEAALVVADDYQGRGLGTALFRRLVRLARQRGISRLVVDTLPENGHMRAVAHDTRYPCIEGLEDGVVRVALALEGPARPT